MEIGRGILLVLKILKNITSGSYDNIGIEKKKVFLFKESKSRYQKGEQSLQIFVEYY